jgi:uncharacterized membrane protein YcjF (UPF0283 family)
VSTLPDASLNGTRWSRRIGWVINLICFIALVAVITTVIYGFWLRAIWAHGYFLAVVVAVVGAFVILVGLAQQAIAARDVATWRAMAEWQIQAARARVARAGGNNDHAVKVEPESAEYYEMLVGTLVRYAEYEQESVTRER